MPVSLPLALVLAAAVVASPSQRDLPQRWMYCPTNLWVDENIDRLEALLRRAAAAGYNGLLLADSKFARLGDMDAHYFANVERVKRIAAELKLEIVPAVFPIGYSNDLLFMIPNLAEALPVRDALFVVRDGVARLQPDPPVSLRGGDFADLKQWDWKDECVTADDPPGRATPDGAAARVIDPRGRNARIVQKLAVRPFAQYHVRVRVRTQDFRGTPEVKVLADGKSLLFSNLGVKPTQDWSEHHAVFNSLDHREVMIYLGCWGGETGSLWWDDAAIEEVGLLNVVRRPGAPLTVKMDKGGVLAEGKDYDEVSDPRMGTLPWKGEYEIWHEPPPLRVKRPDGTRLRVSYYHVVTVYDGQVMICPSEPRTVELLRDQAKRMHAVFAAKAYFMSHDEIRCLNWCEACTRRKLDAGQILADNVRTCTRILHEVAPQAQVYVWSDMFDPNHNAVKDYYLVRGDLSGSWEGLERGVNVGVWYFERRAESMKWFAQRGHRMLIAGYYDDKPERIQEWLSAAPKADAVLGVMYTTWQNKYEDLERFMEAALRR